MTRPPFDDVEMRHEFRQPTESDRGRLDPGRRDHAPAEHPPCPIAADPEAIDLLKAALDWFFETVRSGTENHGED